MQSFPVEVGGGRPGSQDADHAGLGTAQGQGGSQKVAFDGNVRVGEEILQFGIEAQPFFVVGAARAVKEQVFDLSVVDERVQILFQAVPDLLVIDHEGIQTPGRHPFFFPGLVQETPFGLGGATVRYSNHTKVFIMPYFVREPGFHLSCKGTQVSPVFFKAGKNTPSPADSLRSRINFFNRSGFFGKSIQ